MLNAKGKTNCPNCGAPISSEKCPYCGTVFYDFSCIDFMEPTYIKIKHNGEIIMCKAIARHAGISCVPEFRTVTRIGDAMPVYQRVYDTATINLEFDVIPNDGVLFTAVRED